MRTAPVVLVVLLPLVLTGCLAEETSDAREDQHSSTTPPPPTDDPLPGKIPLLLDFAFRDCAGMEAYELVEASQAQALLPENFTIRTHAVAGQDTGQARLVAQLFDCNGFGTGGTNLNGTWYGRIFVDIEGPGTLFEPKDGVQYHYLLRVLGQDDLIGSLWRTAGYDVVLDAADRSFASPLPNTMQGTLTLGAYTFEATGISNDASFVERQESMVSQHPNLGHLVWNGTMHTLSIYSGSGSVQLPDDDPLASPAQGTLEGPADLHEGLSLSNQTLVQIL